MKSRSQKTVKFLAITTAIILSIAYLLPIYVMVLTSLKTPYEITQRTYLIPSIDLHPENYAKAFSLVKNALLNSLIISSSVTAISSFVGGLSGFYLSRFKSKFSKILFVLVGISLYLPYQAILVPLVQLMARTRLALTHAGMIMSYSILNVPLASILMGTFFMSVPREIEEAAEMDGATKRQIFFRVVSPMAMPGYASTAILVFTQVWNEFLLALTLSTPQTATLQVKLAEVKGSFVALYNLQMAAAIIGIVVPVGFFLLLGRYFIRGILAGALKG